MSAYTVTFRIANDSTYADRYTSFVEELKGRSSIGGKSLRLSLRLKRPKI